MKIDATAQAIESALASLGSKATYTGAGVTISGGLLMSEIAIIVGMVIGVLGLFVNWYYKAKENSRAEVEHARRMASQHNRRVGD